MIKLVKGYSSSPDLMTLAGGYSPDHFVQSEPTAPEQSDLPEGVCVVGRTIGNPNEEIVVAYANDPHHQHRHYSVESLLTETKQLAVDMVQHGHVEHAIGKSLRRAATAILRLAHLVHNVVLNAVGLTQFDEDGQVFWPYVWRGRAYWFGPKPNTKVIASDAAPKPQVVGSLKVWKKIVGLLLRGNPYLIVVVVHGLAAALRSRFGQVYLVLLLIGTSSHGKTTVQRVVASMTGSPKNQIGVVQAVGTEVGMYELLETRPDLPICVQDLKLLKPPEAIFNIVYSAADGAKRIKHDVDPGRLSTTLIGSNERSLMELSLATRGTIDGGMFARCTEIFADGPHGMFHDLHGSGTPEEFAKRLDAAVKDNNGVVWSPWVGAIADNFSDVERKFDEWLPVMRRKIARYADGHEMSAVDRRLLDSLAFSAWAGVLASEFGILPIRPDEITESFGLVFLRHMLRRQSGTTPISDKVIGKVRGYIDEHQALFPPLSRFNEADTRATVSGYHHTINGVGDVFLFIPSRFDREFVRDHGEEVFRILQRAGFLHVTKGRGYQFQVRIPGNGLQKAFIAVKATIRFDTE